MVAGQPRACTLRPCPCARPTLLHPLPSQLLASVQRQAEALARLCAHEQPATVALLLGPTPARAKEAYILHFTQPPGALGQHAQPSRQQHQQLRERELEARMVRQLLLAEVSVPSAFEAMPGACACACMA